MLTNYFAKSTFIAAWDLATYESLSEVLIKKTSPTPAHTGFGICHASEKAWGKSWFMVLRKLPAKKVERLVMIRLKAVPKIK